MLNIITSTQNYVKDLIALFYPNICLGCERALKKQEQLVCLHCQYTMPQTNFHLTPDNPIEKHFWGRIWIESACALYGFKKKSRVQQLMHHLKYKGRRELGVYLGAYYGRILKKAKTHDHIDYIIPVPLHPKKERKRGYNQSDAIAEGISKGLGIPWSTDFLKCSLNTSSQTRKSRFDRWKNVSTKFEVYQADELQDKHLLLVDDVVTTGATLEACGLVLLESANVKLSIATLACAQNWL